MDCFRKLVEKYYKYKSTDNIKTTIQIVFELFYEYYDEKQFVIDFVKCLNRIYGTNDEFMKYQVKYVLLEKILINTKIDKNVFYNNLIDKSVNVINSLQKELDDKYSLWKLPLIITTEFPDIIKMEGYNDYKDFPNLFVTSLFVRFLNENVESIDKKKLSMLLKGMNESKHRNTIMTYNEMEEDIKKYL